MRIKKKLSTSEQNNMAGMYYDLFIVNFEMLQTISNLKMFIWTISFAFPRYNSLKRLKRDCGVGG